MEKALGSATGQPATCPRPTDWILVGKINRYFLGLALGLVISAWAVSWRSGHGIAKIAILKPNLPTVTAAMPSAGPFNAHQAVAVCDPGLPVKTPETEAETASNFFRLSDKSSAAYDKLTSDYAILTRTLPSPLPAWFSTDKSNFYYFNGAATAEYARLQSFWHSNP